MNNISDKKVLIIPSWYPTGDNPLAGIFFKEQAKELNREVPVAVLHILEPVKIFEYKKLFRKKISLSYEEGLCTLHLEYVNWIPYCNPVKRFLYRRSIRKGYSVITRQFGRPDILHAHSTLMGGYGAVLLGKEEKIPVVVTEHVNNFNSYFLPPFTHMAQLVLNNADMFTAVSRYLCTVVTRKGRDQCRIIPNFIPPNKFTKKDVPAARERSFRLLNISTLIHYKGIDVLLKAIDILVHTYGISSFFVDIIGDGPQKEEYLSLLKNLSLEKYCTFYGGKRSEDLVDFYNRADALVISSREETFGIVGIEAMSVGIPVVSTKCGGPEDYITEKTGILVDNDNPEKLAEGIKYLMDMYENFHPGVIRAEFLKSYSSDVVVGRWIQTYSELIQKGTITE